MAEKNYFHDKTILFLLTVNVFVAVLTGVLIGLRLGSGDSQIFTIQYRANLGINPYKFGNTLSMLSFILFSLGVAGLHFLISVRAYRLRRNLAVSVLSLGLLLLVLNLVVSSSLLTSR